MRVAVLFFGGGKREETAEIARGLAAGIESMGHQVDIIDGERDVNAKLTAYSYIAVGTAPTTRFKGKISDKIREYLARSGMIAGKKTFAFITKTAFGGAKALRRLMAALEHEGMFVRSSQILRSREEAEVLGSRLKV